jgi:invasion protein IalB
MRPCSKLSARSLKAAAGVVLCVLAFSHGVVAQTAQPKTGQPAPRPAAPAKPAPIQPTWAVICENAQTGLDCRAVQSVRLNDGRATLNVAVRVPQDTKKPVLLLQLPLGLYLPAGVAVQIGQGGAKAVPFEICDQNGCMARYPVTDIEIVAMQKGEDLTVTAQTPSKRPIAVKVPVTGFPAAYAKIK